MLLHTWNFNPGWKKQVYPWSFLASGHNLLDEQSYVKKKKEGQCMWKAKVALWPSEVYCMHMHTH